MTDDYSEDLDILFAMSVASEGESLPDDAFDEGQFYRDDHTESVIDKPAFTPATVAVDARVPSLGLRRPALSTEFSTKREDKAWALSPKVPGTTDRYLIHRAGITILAGKSGQGKSWLGMDLTRRALDAGGSVLYFDFENDEKIVQERMLQVGADPEHLGEEGSLYISMAPEYLNSIAGVSPISQFKQQMMNEALAIKPSLIVFDSMSHLLQQLSPGSSANDEESYIQIFKALRGVLSVLDIPAVIIAHTPKGNDRTVRGSDAITNQVDSVFFIEATTMFNGDRDGVLSVHVGKDRHDVTGKQGQTFRAAINTVSTPNPTVDLGAGPRLITDSLRIDWDPGVSAIAGPQATPAQLLPEVLLRLVDGTEATRTSLKKDNLPLSNLYKHQREAFDSFFDTLTTIDGLTVEEKKASNNKQVEHYKLDGTITKAELFEAAETAFNLDPGSIEDAISETDNDPF